jgi:hypothetical protein
VPRALLAQSKPLVRDNSSFQFSNPYIEPQAEKLIVCRGDGIESDRADRRMPPTTRIIGADGEIIRK